MLKVSRRLLPPVAAFLQVVPFLLAALLLPASVHAADDAPQAASIAAKTASAQKLPGYFTLYWDAKQG